jgi:hypothetical protein
MAHENEKAIAWLKANGDSIERLCADEVCALIPQYALLWARFIGNTGEARRYPLSGLEGLAHETRKAVEVAFDGLCASHYTIFNHVRSCQNKLRTAQDEEDKPYTGLTHAAFMEAMEEFYFHYGIIVTQWERIWAALLGIDPNDSRLRQKVWDLLKGINFDNNGWARGMHYTVLEIIDDCRNSVEHYPRTAMLRDEDAKRLMVRVPRKKGELLQEVVKRDGRDVLAVEMMKLDFEVLKSLLDSTYPKLIEHIETFLTKHNLQAMAQDAFNCGALNRMETGRLSLSANVGMSGTSGSSSTPRMIGSAVIPTVLKPFKPQG